MAAFIVLHQDVWSCYSGGSWAPGWALDAVVFDPHALEESGAAWLRVKGGGHIEAERGVWPSGYQTATMACVLFLSFHSPVIICLFYQR
jgi:hypothetical protein